MKKQRASSSDVIATAALRLEVARAAHQRYLDTECQTVLRLPDGGLRIHVDHHPAVLEHIAAEDALNQLLSYAAAVARQGASGGGTGEGEAGVA